MNFHEFGDKSKSSILLLHGACMHWTMFQKSVDRFSRDYHVIVPAIEGHDYEDTKDFSSVESIVEQITNYLYKNAYKELFAIYGLSMGGGIAVRFLAENRIPVKKAIIDGGMTPYKLPKILIRFILVRDYLGVRLLQSNRKILEMVFSPEKFTKEGIDVLENVVHNMSKKTIKNVFYSANNYSMPDPVPKIYTEIQYWYGSLEKKARKWDMQYVKKTFPQTYICEIDGCEHGEFCSMHTEEFVKKVSDFLQNKKEVCRTE